MTHLPSKTLDRNLLVPLQESAQHLAEDAEQFSRQQVKVGLEKAKELQSQVVGCIKERPLTSIAIGIVAGLLIGKLLKS